MKRIEFETSRPGDFCLPPQSAMQNWKNVPHVLRLRERRAPLPYTHYHPTTLTAAYFETLEAWLRSQTIVLLVRNGTEREEVARAGRSPEFR